MLEEPSKAPEILNRVIWAIGEFLLCFRCFFTVQEKEIVIFSAPYCKLYIFINLLFAITIMNSINQLPVFYNSMLFFRRSEKMLDNLTVPIRISAHGKLSYKKLVTNYFVFMADNSQH